VVQVSRLTWDAINLGDKEIRLEGIQTKTGRARVISISATLLAWLKAYKDKPIFPAGWRIKFDAVKLAAGFGTPTETQPDLKPWVPDIMRHTAASHYFRNCGSYGQTAEQFGNSEQIIKAHYQGRVSTADTKIFYSIKPKA
jgi:integrase